MLLIQTLSVEVYKANVMGLLKESNLLSVEGKQAGWNSLQ